MDGFAYKWTEEVSDMFDYNFSTTGWLCSFENANGEHGYIVNIRVNLENVLI